MRVDIASCSVVPFHCMAETGCIKLPTRTDEDKNMASVRVYRAQPACGFVLIPVLLFPIRSRPDFFPNALSCVLKDGALLPPPLTSNKRKVIVYIVAYRQHTAYIYNVFEFTLLYYNTTYRHMLFII